VDGGDFGSNKSKSQILKVEYLLKGMALLNYDAINLGEKDLQYGREFLSEMQSAYRLPFVSANVYDLETGKLFARPYVIKQAGGLKFGIFGVALAQGLETTVPRETGFQLKDPLTAAAAVAAELRKKCDVVIALAHLGLNGAQELAQTVAGIDFIISGHNASQTHLPQKIGDTAIMQPGYQGKYLGQIDFTISSANIITSVAGKTVALSDKIADDPALAKLVKEYEEALISKYPTESPQAQSQFSFISERSCLSCHANEHKQWRATLHQMAWQTLVAKKQNHNPQCQVCHTTWFGEANGFINVRETPDLVNVQCVECHRPAADIRSHLKRVRGQPSANATPSNGEVQPDFLPVAEHTCLKCHDQTNSPHFDYEKYLAKVRH
jgi:hypothetical protein